MIWWVLVGVLLIGFALTDGFDLGAAMLMPYVGRSDTERRVVINTIAPHWDGNQVWLITAGGALFAAWPLVYAAAFSGLYWALLLVLFALFVRPVGFDYRSKLENTRWRQSWDWGLFIGGVVPSLVFGVAFGNLLLGVPFQFDDTLRSSYQGNFWQLLSPFGLLAGVVSLSMLGLHGGSWLMMRTEGAIAQRSRRAAQWLSLVFLLSFIGAGVWLLLGDHLGVRCRRCAKPAGENRDGQQPRLAGELSAAPADGRRTVVGDFRWLAGLARRQCGAGQNGIPRQQPGHRRRVVHGRFRAVPVRHAVEPGPGVKPDRVGRCFQP
jgi:cytochrome d oxidase subunit CydB